MTAPSSLTGLSASATVSAAVPTAAAIVCRSVSVAAKAAAAATQQDQHDDDHPSTTVITAHRIVPPFVYSPSYVGLGKVFRMIKTQKN